MEFYKPVDARAADALQLLETDVQNSSWPPALRQAWRRDCGATPSLTPARVTKKLPSRVAPRSNQDTPLWIVENELQIYLIRISFDVYFR